MSVRTRGMRANEGAKLLVVVALVALVCLVALGTSFASVLHDVSVALGAGTQ